VAHQQLGNVQGSRARGQHQGRLALLVRHLCVAACIEQHFDQLYAHTEHGFKPLWRPAVRELIITWEPAHAHWAQ